MALQIIKGKIAAPVRGIFSGTEGIGKSTLAAQIPGAVFIDTEDGSSQIDCARILATDWRAIENAVKELIADQQGFTTVVIDTADWLERALIEWMLKRDAQKSIESYGYGKGYTMLQEHFARFLALCDQLIAKGIHVVFVAHTKTVRVSPPDQTDGYDRWELKLTKQVSPLLKEWSTLYLFANYKIQIVEGTDGRLKAQGGKERVMYANRCAAWDAKNRYGLPDEMPMDFAQVAKVFDGAVARPLVNVAPVAPVVAPTVSTEPVPTLATMEQLAQLLEFKKSKKGAEMIEAALEQINGIDCSELTVEQAAELITNIDVALPKVASSTNPTVPGNLPPHFVKWLDANADAVNAYLVRVKWLVAGQTWRDLTDEKAHSIVDKSDKFARAAGITAIGGAK